MHLWHDAGKWNDLLQEIGKSDKELPRETAKQHLIIARLKLDCSTAQKENITGP